MIIIAGISIAFFISALLLFKKGKTESDILLLIWMLILAIHLSFFYVFSKGELHHYPALLGWQFPMPLLHGIFLFFYVSSVTDQLPKPQSKMLWHFIPPLAFYVYLIPYMLSPAKHKIEVFANKGVGYETFQLVLVICISFSGIIYFIWSLWLLKKHRQRIQNQFSALEEINLNWLRFLTYGLGGVWCLVILTQNDTTIFYGVAVFVILIGFFGVQQREIFKNKKPEKTLNRTEGKVEINPFAVKEKMDKEKYVKSGLTQEVAKTEYDRLLKLMTEKELYRNNELSLTYLATELNIHPNYLSQIINEKEGKSFYEFVNFFRIEEFKRLIAIPENQKFTLMTLAYDCGFNSKSSFNRHFKKSTGQTPSEYAKVMIRQDS